MEATQEAIVGMTGYRVNNKVLLCKLSNSSTNSSNPEVSNNLYIRPLPSSIGEGIFSFTFHFLVGVCGVCFFLSYFSDFV